MSPTIKYFVLVRDNFSLKEKDELPVYVRADVKKEVQALIDRIGEKETDITVFVYCVPGELLYDILIDTKQRSIQEIWMIIYNKRRAPLVIDATLLT